jgi:hypothetical protein
VTEDLSHLLKPRVPVPDAPRGFVELERYSSIKRLWDWLEGLHRQGFEILVPKRAIPEHCRREVRGLSRSGAGGLLDDAALIELLGKDETAILEAFSLEREALAAVNRLLAGDRSGVVALLNRDYRLVFQIQLCFTARRELMLKADASFEAFSDRIPPFPASWNLKPVRWRREDYRQLLDRAARGLLLP